MSNSVEDVLRDNNIPFQRSGRRFLINCLNPEHPDKNPSMSIDSITGLGKCFSCGHKINLFTHFGAAYNYQSIKVFQLQNKLEVLKSSLLGLEMPDNFVPETREFRGISAKTLQKYGAFIVSGNDEYKDRIVFPIKDQTGKIRCFLARHKYSDAQPKYIIRPHKVEVPIFPPIVKPYKGSVLLVEGIFDALNLIDNGMDNVVCVFGTSTITEKSKHKLVPLKLMGVSKIYILFDGDVAGKKAAELLKPIIQKMEFDCETIELPEDVDPGDLSKEDIQKLKELL